LHVWLDRQNPVNRLEPKAVKGTAPSIRHCHQHLGAKALPEYETMSHFHALLENRDMRVVMEANRACNDLGMDTISAGATLVCHAEVIGQPLAPETIVPLLEDIALSRGIDRELKVGSRTDCLFRIASRERKTEDNLLFWRYCFLGKNTIHQGRPFFILPEDR
jgi:hypothetical protein